MTMPPWSDDPEAPRPYFRRLRELAERHGLRAAFHGHVARSGDGNRRGLHLRTRRHRAVREAEEGVTVGFFSPLPPARTGVADYSAALLADLRRHGASKLRPNAATSRSTTWATTGCTRRSTGGAREPGSRGAARCRSASFLPRPTRPRRRTSTSSSTTMATGIGALAAELWKGRAASGSDSRYFDYPMLKRVAERSRAVVVHNPAAARTVAEHAPGARISGDSAPVRPAAAALRCDGRSATGKNWVPTRRSSCSECSDT